jgi:suppressor of fused
MWAMSFLQNLGRYVFQSGKVFAPGDHVDLNGPIALDHDTAIGAAFFTVDPELGEIATPHGRLQFIQVVGATIDELEAGRRWNTAGLLDVMGRRFSLLVTDLARASVLGDAECAAEVARRTALEGSSTGTLFHAPTSWRLVEGGAEVEIGTLVVPQLKSLLPGRVPFGRGLLVAGGKLRVGFEPGDGLSWEQTDEQMLVVRMDAASARELADRVQPRPGDYVVGGLRLKVVPSYIRDAAGNVVRVV